MIIQRNFSKKESRKLKLRDRLHMIGAMKGELKDQIVMDDPNSSGKEYRKARNRQLGRMALGGIGGGALAGAATFGYLGRSKKVAATGAGIGALLGTAATAGGALGLATRRGIIKGGKSSSYNRLVERQNDSRRVRVGDMTADDFKKKWYKK